jgi:two-component system, NarL family, sensor histidine kinase UhpB
VEYRATLNRRGAQRKVAMLGSTVRISAGGKFRLLLCLLDVTKEKRTEELWHESEHRYRAVVEDQTEIICRFRADGICTFVNDVYCRFFGKKSRQLLGKKWQPRAVSEDLPMIEERLRTLTPVNPTVIVENRVLSRNNKVRWMQFANRGFFDSEGRLIEIQSVGRDITERRQAEQALLESEARLRAIFEHSMAGILLTSPDGRVFAANPAACRLLGRTEADICRAGRSRLVDRQDSRFYALLKERSEKGYAQGETTFIRADGTSFPVQIASTVFETGEGLRTSIVFLDISERKRAEESIHRFSQKLLSVREDEKRHLSAVLHYEVGSATVGIMARLSAAEHDLRKGREREALAWLKECRELYMQAAKSLKTLAVELRPPDLDLLGLRTSLRRLFTRIARETSLKIHFTDTTRSKVISPEIQTCLFRTAQECLNNVVNHAGAHHVRVRLSIARRRIRLCIADDGKGFVPEHLTIKPVLHLGLRTMQEMAAGLGGKLDVVSNPGSGAKVTVIVPEAARIEE